MIPATRLEELTQLMGPRGVEELLATLLSDFARSAAELEAALRDGDAEELARASHTVISLAATLAARDLAERARATQMAGNAGSVEAATLGSALLADLRAVAGELRNMRSRRPA